MNIRELAKPLTSKALNESLAKKFGTKINVDKFTLEQLEDARNKIRTSLSQTETTESFDSVHSSSDYQKNKLFLDVLNVAIAEREEIAEKGSKPDYLDFDKDGDKKEPMKKALKDKKKKPVGEATLPFDKSMTKDPEFRAWHKVYMYQGPEAAEKIPGHEKFLKIQQAWNAKSDMDSEIEKANEPKYMEILKKYINTAKSSAEFKDYIDAEFEKDDGFRKWLGSGSGSKTPQGRYARDLYYRQDEADTPNLDKINKGIDDYYTGFDALGGKSPTGELMKLIAKGIYNALDAAGVQVEPEKIKKAAANAATTLESKQSKSKETQIVENYFAHAKKLFEGEEDKAEIVMAAKDMVDRVTGWMEDTAEMQAESMLELGDAIRDEMGEAQSETFIQTVKPALESLYTALESTRGALTGGVGQLTGEAEPAVDMGTPDEMPAEDPAMEPTVDAEAGDDFGAAEPAAGGEDEAGRAKRESIDLSRRLGTILSSKKK